MSSALAEEECDAWFALLRAPKLGAARIRLAVARAGTAAAACAAGKAFWREFGVGSATVSLLRGRDAKVVARDRAWFAQPERHLVTFRNDEFPPQLERGADPPAALFVHGDPTALWSPQIAIVGARSATASGLATARDFAATLARAGLVVTSGLADGVDGAAHAGAMAAGGTTVAVCGTGLDEVYPAKHERLAAQVAANGAMVSEFALGTPARAPQFPQRNRVIAALSLGVLVVEAGVRSGSLITARCGADIGREVFAIPGSIHNPMARGCHRLIREGAKLVETAEDVLEELAPLAQQQGAQIAALLAQEPAVRDSAGGARRGARSDPQRDALLAALGHDPASVDELCARSGLTAPAVSSMLLLLELDGVVAAQAGARYCRIRGP